jgi:shikimate dehydrogenase
LLAGERGADLRALVLGTGGASAAVQYVLRREGIDYRLVSRTAVDNSPGAVNNPLTSVDNPQEAVDNSRAAVDNRLTYRQLTPEIVNNHRLIVNTTPLGTWPDVADKPDLPYDGVGEGHFLYDLVYNPPLTAFLTEGLRRGAAVLNGEEMLRAQAEKAWGIWNSESPQQ